ncbi:MAG: hypothetical protein L0Y64_01400 [Myxococcaceae bacterium]|nr:hypothetical protein [Myxococcaceae bacterium]
MLQLVSFGLVAFSPVGGMVAAIPLGMLAFQMPTWQVWLLGVVSAYAQVVAVDLAWSGLERLQWWRRLLERQQSPRLRRLLSAPGAFWPTVVLVPIVGAWVVMGLMRYAGVPQRRVAVPILVGLALFATVLCAGCALVPEWFTPGEALAALAPR